MKKNVRAKIMVIVVVFILFSSSLAFIAINAFSFEPGTDDVSAQQLTSQVVQGDINHPPFRPSFDLIALLDVLEHLEDDTGVLETLRALLKPGGALLLTVPARRSLWSYVDEAGHRGRQSRREAPSGFSPRHRPAP